jgi:hypothetical protein
MWGSYGMALNYYTLRHVSYPSDILNAFEGIKAVLCDAMQTDFWQGMPEKIMAEALCWQLKGPFSRSRNRPSGQPPSEPLFPSWSWAGWEGPVNLNSFIPINAYRSDVEWFIVNDNSIATRLNVWPDVFSKYSPPKSSDSGIDLYLPHLVPRHEVDATSQHWRDARTLACWTTCASFLIDGSTHIVNSKDGEERLRPESTIHTIKDIQGVTAGCILLPKDFLETYGIDSLNGEFIMISRTEILRKTDFQRTLQYYDPTVYTAGDWCMNVMLISGTRNSEALRLGVGVVHKDAWIGAQPEPTFVKLV